MLLHLHMSRAITSHMSHVPTSFVFGHMGLGSEGLIPCNSSGKVGKLTQDCLGTGGLEDEEVQSWFRFRVCRALSFGAWVCHNWEG